MNLTFFDYIGAADMERIHSATIAWMISDYCSALTIGEKTRILNILFKTEKSGLTSIETINEFEHLDIAVITTDKTGQKELWVLENKVKAQLGFNQLSKYSKRIAEGYNEENSKKVNDMIKAKHCYAHNHFAVLSLIGQLPQDQESLGEWSSSTYDELSAELDSIFKNKGNADSPQMEIVKEYYNCISYLVNALSEFRKNPQAFSNVFTDGSKAKAVKTTLNLPGLPGYIAANGLETLFQKAYFTDIVNEIFQEIFESNEIKIKYCHVGESRGNADLAFHFGPIADYDNGKIRYCGDLSFQNGAFKIAVAQENYPRRSEEGSLAETLLNKWVSVFEEYNNEEYNNKYKSKSKSVYNRINEPKSRARVSLSYNIGKDWYSMYDRESFISLVKDQLAISQEILDEIVKAWRRRIENERL